MNNTKILLIVLASIGIALMFIKKLTQLPTPPAENQPLILMDQSSSQSTNSQPTAPQPLAAPDPKQFTKPEAVIDQTKTYLVTLKTDQGDITIQLDTQQTPITANNFVFLAQQGFYNQTIFHRVINGFMVQGGDPQGTGSGGPGYKFNDEPITGEYTRGTVAMANAGP
ncbi:MAG: peptidylprolyl isomerase, partial [Patescibacteria group bacterium]|nr:peptidylprolyl isomerase [Patescibacteria group bacterium]